MHNFPHGLVSFVDGLSTDPLRHKLDFLKGNINYRGKVMLHYLYISATKPGLQGVQGGP